MKSTMKPTKEGEKKIRNIAARTLIQNQDFPDRDGKRKLGFSKGNALTQDITERRLIFILQKLTTGMSFYEVRKAFAEQEGVCLTTAHKWMMKAYDYMAEEAQAIKHRLAEVNLMRLDHIYSSCMTKKDYMNAISALKEQNKMVGGYAPEKKDINATVDTDIVVSFGE